MNKRSWARWIPAIAIMAVIFYFSSQPYHKQDLRPRLHTLLPEQQITKLFSFVDFQYSGERVSISRLGVPGFVEFFIRKGAHLSIYFLLALSIAYALNRRGRSGSALFLLAVVLCALYAASDEFHQSITGDRTPLAIDVGVDTIGAAIGAFLFVILRRGRRFR